MDAWNIVGFIVISIVLLGLQFVKAWIYDAEDFSFKRTMIEVVVIGLAVAFVLLLIGLL